MPSVTLPAPTTWNARDPVDQLAANESPWLANMVTVNGVLTLHEAPTVTSSVTSGVALMGVYEHVAADGTRKILASSKTGTAAGKIWDVTTSTGTDITGGSPDITGSVWFTHQINGKLILVNGGDQPRQYDGATVTNAAFTGITDDADLAQGCVYKSRQYFVAKNSQSIWYGGINAVTGALTEFPVGAYLSKGGPLRWVSSFSRGQGSISQDMLVVAGANGDILLYAGNYPGDQWQLVAHYITGYTMGRAGFAHVESDLMFMTSAGIESLASLMAGQPEANPAAAINPGFLELCRVGGITDMYSYGAYSTWTAAVSKERGWALFQISDGADDSYYGILWNYKERTWSALTGWPYTLPGMPVTSVVSASGNIYAAYQNSIYKMWGSVPFLCPAGVVVWPEISFGNAEVKKTFNHVTAKILASGETTVVAVMAVDYAPLRYSPNSYSNNVTTVAPATPLEYASAQIVELGLSGSGHSGQLRLYISAPGGAVGLKPGPAAIRNATVDLILGGRF